MSSQPNRITSENSIRISKLRSLGLCTRCGKISVAYGYDICKKCARKRSINAKNHRDKINRIKFDNLVDKNLIDVKETADLLNISLNTAYSFINKGLLPIKETAFKKSYLSQIDAAQLSRKRYQMKCLDCGYIWNRRYLNCDNLRCHKLNCRSTNVIRIYNDSHNTTGVPKYCCNVCDHHWDASKNIAASNKNNLTFRKPKQCPKCHTRKWEIIKSDDETPS